MRYLISFIALLSLTSCFESAIIEAGLENNPDAVIVVDVTASKYYPETGERINLAASVQEIAGARVIQYEWVVVTAPATDYSFGSAWDPTTWAIFRAEGQYTLSFRVTYKDRLENTYVTNTTLMLEVMETNNG